MPRSFDPDSAVFATEARIVTRAAPDAVVQLARGRALDPDIFDELPPFYWLNEISSDRLDAYFTRMDPATTLRNFAADAAEGRAFLLGHDHRSMPFGSTLTGDLLAGDGASIVQAWGMCLVEDQTAPFRNRTRAGIQKDVSVGFGRGKWICSICGRDMMRDWDCWHIPGIEYEVKATGSSGSLGSASMVLCTVTIVDARLSEVSAVFDGATPGAAILQAERAAEAGQLPAAHERLITSRYRIRLPERRIVAPGATLEEPTPMAGENPIPAPAPRQLDDEDADVRATLDDARNALAQAEERLTALAGERDALAQQVAELTPLAADGRAYRSDLIDQLVAEGVRAHGAGFDEKTYRSLVATAPIATIKRMRDDMQALGDARLPAGRQSVEGGDPKGAPAPKPEKPTSAYRT